VRAYLASCGGEEELRSDVELIRGAKDDPELFRELYDRYAVRIHAFFRRRTGSPDAALDLTAETFAQAWTSKDRFRDLASGSAGPWLFTIARRVLIASARRRHLETRALHELRLDALIRGGADVQPHPGWLHGLEDDLSAALAELPKQQREAVALRVLGELSYTAIARRLGCTSTAARIRVSRGLKGLRARLETNQP